jgi:hypothetical protein
MHAARIGRIQTKFRLVLLARLLTSKGDHFDSRFFQNQPGLEIGNRRRQVMPSYVTKTQARGRELESEVDGWYGTKYGKQKP